MAAKATIQLRGSFESLPIGSRAIAPTDMINLTAPSGVTRISLVSGDNTIPVPTGSRGFIVIFDPLSVTKKALKGGAGDTGIIVGETGWAVCPLDSSMTGIIINSDVNDNSGGGSPTLFYTEVTFF